MRRILGSIALASLLSGCLVRGAGAYSASTVYASSTPVDLAVTNASGRTVCYLYLSPVSDPNWGPDQLGSRVLPSGRSEIYRLYAGQWDIRADDCSHNRITVLRNTTIASNSQLVIQ